jgi:hypothetical protein
MARSERLSRARRRHRVGQVVLGCRRPPGGANPRPAVLSKRTLNAEEIVVTLSVARANISVYLKESQGWGLVKVHVRSLA